MGKKLVIVACIINIIIIFGFCVIFYFSMIQETNNVGTISSAALIFMMTLLLCVWTRGVWKWDIVKDDAEQQNKIRRNIFGDE